MDALALVKLAKQFLLSGITGAIGPTGYNRFWAASLGKANSEEQAMFINTYIGTLLIRLWAEATGLAPSIVELDQLERLLQSFQAGGFNTMASQFAPGAFSNPESSSISVTASTSSIHASVSDSKLVSTLNQRIQITAFFLALFYGTRLHKPKYHQKINLSRNACRLWLFTRLPLGQRAPYQFLARDGKLVLDPTIQTSNKIFDGLVDMCAGVGSHIGLTPIDPWPDIIQSSEICPGFAYPYLQQCLYQGNNVDVIFQYIIANLGHPLLPADRLLALLHMITQFIYLNCHISDIQLKAAKTTIEAYLLWPQPYCQMADITVQFLDRAIDDCGEANREHVIKETPEVAAILKPPRKVMGREVHMLLNPKSEYGNLLFTFLEIGKTADISPDSVQIMLLLNILEIFLPDEDTDMIHPTHMLRIPAGTTGSLLADAYSIVTKSKDIPISERKSFLATKLKPIYDSVVSHAGCLTKVKHQGGRVRSTARPSDLVFRWNILQQTGSFNKLDCHSDTLIPITGVEENLHKILIEAAAKEAKSSLKSKNKTQIRIGIAGGDGTLLGIVMSWTHLIQSQKEMFTHIRPVFYIIPCGYVNNCSKFISSFDGWYRRHVYGTIEAMTNLIPTIRPRDVKAPKSGTDGSKLLQTLRKSMGDINVLATIHAEGSVAATAVETFEESDEEYEYDPDDWGSGGFEGGSDSEDENDALGLKSASINAEKEQFRQMMPLHLVNPTPAIYSRHMIQDFLRTAKNINHFSVFSCKVTFPSKEVRFVPFLQNIQVGYPVQLAKERRISQFTTLDQLLNAKDGYSPPAVRVAYNKMDLVGAVRIASPLLVEDLCHMSVSNVAILDEISKDRGPTSNPSNSCLELHIARLDPSTLKKTTTKKKSLFSKTKNAISSIGSGKNTTTTLKSITNSSHDGQLTAHSQYVRIWSDHPEGFEILIDSEVFGPITKAEITEITHDDGSPLTFPLMTHLPLIM